MPEPDNFTSREQRFIAALRQAALTNNPNPGRFGCPDQKTLEGVARRQVPMMDIVIDHVWQCSPCAQDVLRYRSASKRPRWAVPGAIAAPVLLMVFSVVLWKRMTPTQTEPVQKPRASSGPLTGATVAKLDLRPFGITRGRSGERQSEPALRRERLILEMYLPVGSEEGRYELRIMNSDFQMVLTRTVDAKLTQQVVTIVTDLDLRSVKPGRYTLALRLSGDDWRTYPITLE